MTYLAYLLSLPITWITFCLVQGSLILLLTLLAWRLSTQLLSASHRHLILLFGLAGLSGAFVLHVSTPGWTGKDETSNRSSHATSQLSDVVLSKARLHTLERSPNFQTNANTKEHPGIQKSLENPHRGLPLATPPKTTSSTLPIAQSQTDSLFVWLGQRLAAVSPWIGLCWLVVSSIWLARIIFGFIRWQRLKKTAHPISSSVLLEHDRQSVPRSLKILESPSATLMPMTGGLLHPTILVPQGFSEWTLTNQKIVLLHEQAHVIRRDAFANLFSQMALAVGWFHPLIWLVASLSRLESERATDDRVITSGIAASDYAQVLLEITRRFTTPTDTSHRITAGMAHESSLSRRINSIIDITQKRNPTRLRFAFLTAFAFVVLSLGSQLVPVDTSVGGARINSDRFLFADIAQNNQDSYSVTEPSVSSDLPEGFVTHMDGTPASDAVIHWCVGDTYRTIPVNKQGFFRLPSECWFDDGPSPSAAGILLASSPDGQWQAAQSISFSKQSEWKSRPIRLKLNPAIETTVTVVKDGQPVENAWVIVEWSWGKILNPGIAQAPKVVTDRMGQATLRVPQSFSPTSNVWAFHPNSGMAHWDYPDSILQNQFQPRQHTFQLHPTSSRQVQLIDQNDQPVSGVNLTNLAFPSGFPESQVTTDATGMATFSCITLAAENLPVKVEHPGYKQIWMPSEKKQSPLQEIRVFKKLPIRGRVIGAPHVNLRVAVAGDILLEDPGPVVVDGIGPKTYGHVEKYHIRTDANGEFMIHVFPGAPYTFAVMDQHWVSDAVELLLFDTNGNPQDELNIEAYPATTVMATVKNENGAIPAQGGSISISSAPRGNRSPGRQVPLDANGKATFGLGKGRWHITAHYGFWRNEQVVNVRNADPILVSFPYDWTFPPALTGQVTTQDPGVDITGLEIVYLEQLRPRSWPAPTDLKGQFTIQSDNDRIHPFSITTPDKTFSGLKHSFEDVAKAAPNRPVEIELLKTASLVGQLVDEQGQPLPHQLLTLHSKFTDIQCRLNQTQTDKDGSFEFHGIIAQTPLIPYLQLGNDKRLIVGEEMQFDPGEARNNTTLVFKSNHSASLLIHQLGSDVRLPERLDLPGLLVMVHGTAAPTKQLADLVRKMLLPDIFENKQSWVKNLLHIYPAVEFGQHCPLMEKLAQEKISLPETDGVLFLLLNKEFEILDSIPVKNLAEMREPKTEIDELQRMLKQRWGDTP